jgi:phytoene dehydrogenase-like protein
LTTYDAIVVGSGPNGLAAGITLAETGRSVLLLEAKETIGGGMRTAELTLPGFHHDICSAVHPLGLGSPFFRGLDLAQYGLEWIQPEIPMAHPFDNGSAAALRRSVEETAEMLGKDGRNYRRLVGPLAKDWQKIIHEFLGPLSRNLDVFLGVQNLFDTEYHVGLVPTTIGSPRLVNAGIRIGWAGR